MLKLNDFANNSDMVSLGFSIETLVKEIKRVLTFKDDFENGDKLIKTAYFGLYGITEIGTREKMTCSSNVHSYTSFQISIENLIGEIKPGNTATKRV